MDDFKLTTNYGSARRRFAPMQVQLGLEYRFGGPPLNPIARGLGLREPVDKPPLTDDQRRAAVANLKRDPALPYVQLRDSLSLSPAQLSPLDEMSKEYRARADTALAPLTKWVVRKGTRIFDQDLGQHLSAAQSALARVNAAFANRAQAVLTSAQLARFKTLTTNAGRR